MKNLTIIYFSAGKIYFCKFPVVQSIQFILNTFRYKNQLYCKYIFLCVMVF